MSSSTPKIIIKPRSQVTAVADTAVADTAADSEEEGLNESEGEDSVSTPAPIGAEQQSEVVRPRGRGRPRGTGTSTPKARGVRGRGRGRGRGSLVIRLPKREDQEDNENQTDEDPLDPAAEEKEAPLGGGKPFKRVGDKIYIIENDELATEDDEKGDTKIDKNGVLLGGRTFKASTFVLPNRHPQRVYMLAIDAARTSGFRDSLYYFRRNPLAHKLNVSQPEKEYLIAEGKLGSHLRTRSVTLITVRSAFKLHGSKMIIDGRWVTDDYYESKALEEAQSRGCAAGDLVGTLPDPTFYSHEATALALASKGGANPNGVAQTNGGTLGVYRPGGPTTIFGGAGWGPYSDGPLNAARKGYLNREGVGEETFMFEAAKRSSEATAAWASLRQKSRIPLGGLEQEKATTETFQLPTEDLKEEEEEGDETATTAKREGEPSVSASPKRRKVRKEELPLGVYEPHSNSVFYRVDTQPTTSRWEVVPDSAEKRKVLGGTKTGNGAWALCWIDTVLDVKQPDTTTDRLREEEVAAAIAASQ